MAFDLFCFVYLWCKNSLKIVNSILWIINVTGGQPLKLAHSLLGYAVGMTDINRPGWPITRKQTHRNKF